MIQDIFSLHWNAIHKSIERFEFIPSIKITSVVQNENTNIIHKYYTLKTENATMNSRLTEDKS